MPGVAKLVFNICATFLGTIDISLGVIFSLIRSIWAITDIFVCYKHCKIHNYQKLVAFLRTHEAERVPRNSNSFSQHNNSDNSRPETPKKEVSLEPIVEKNEEETQTNNYRENVLPGVLTAIPVTVSTDWIFTCPQCSQKIRITVVAPNYSCPRCLRVISYSDISTLGGTK